MTSLRVFAPFAGAPPVWSRCRCCRYRTRSCHCSQSRTATTTRSSIAPTPTHAPSPPVQSCRAVVFLGVTSECRSVVELTATTALAGCAPTCGKVCGGLFRAISQAARLLQSPRSSQCSNAAKSSLDWLCPSQTVSAERPWGPGHHTVHPTTATKPDLQAFRAFRRATAALKKQRRLFLATRKRRAYLHSNS